MLGFKKKWTSVKRKIKKLLMRQRSGGSKNKRGEGIRKKESRGLHKTRLSSKAVQK